MKSFLNIKNGKLIHLRQGDLDGACAVYSLMMGLVAAKKVRKNDLTDFDIFERDKKPDGRTSFARLLKEFFYIIPKSNEDSDNPETILLRKGYTLEQIQKKLSHAYSKEVRTLYVSCDDPEDVDAYLDRRELLGFIADEIDKGHPVVINCSFGQNGGHVVLAVGYERSYDELKRLFCLDPGYDCPKRGRYNAVISMTHNGRRSQYHERMERSVRIHEALSIE